MIDAKAGRGERGCHMSVDSADERGNVAPGVEVAGELAAGGEPEAAV